MPFVRQRHIFLIVLPAILALIISGCSAEARLASGIEIYETGEYHAAIEKFRSMDFDNRYYRAQASYYLGMSYYRAGQGQRAAAYLQRAIRYGLSEPEAHLYAGQALRMREEYEDAIEEYEAYLEQDVGNRTALNGIRSCRMALDPPEETRHETEMVRDLRSREGDYSPAFAGDNFTMVYFSSMRGGDKKRNTNQITGQGSSLIYQSLQDGRGGWEDPTPFTGNKELQEDDGTPAFSQDGKEMYFTRCTFPDEGPEGASIMMMRRSGGQWSDPEEISLGADSLVFAHPAISPDGETLVFVSDMPGGHGGKDLWKVTRSSGSDWGVPENMGPEINTPADEMFPRFRSDGRLYFSSDGLVGYGGLDIFEATYLEEEEEWDVQNMGRPINSSSHDFGIVFRGNRNIGFFSSSRGSYRGVDDIYEFELPVIQAVFKGRVTNSSGDPVANARIQVTGNNGTNMTARTSDEGRFNFVLEPEAEYIIIASAPGYYNGRASLSTEDLEESEEFEETIVLQKAE
ncbi:MAG: carboxypeptidase regulatory-like domain-containing protein [Marinilabiliaceae bacterium]